MHRTINNLYRRGARVFNSSRHGVHASGHASREELKLLLTLTRPRYFIPVHGEYRHLALHAALARSVGIPAERVLAIDNGTVIALDEHGVRPTGERVRTGYVYVDGLSIEEAGDVVFRDRQQLAQDGVILVVLTVERSSGAVVAGPDLVSRGFVADDADALFDEAREHVLSLVSRLTPDAGLQRVAGGDPRGSLAVPLQEDQAPAADPARWSPRSEARKQVSTTTHSCSMGTDVRQCSVWPTQLAPVPAAAFAEVDLLIASGPIQGPR